MARVEIEKPREQAAHFGLYRTSAGGDEGIIVRRKVGDPTDFMHTRSRKLARQRENLALASQHYAHLSPSQKAITRHQIEEVEYQNSHGKTDIKLLQGRQLFIAKEMHSLETTGKQLLLPHELCIMLVDNALYPLEGELWLRYLANGVWLDCGKEELATGSWLFSQVPPGQEAYRVYGEAEGYTDLQLPEHQFMTEDYLRAYHYHRLIHTAGFYSYSFAASYWSHSSRRQAFVPCQMIHIRTELTSYAFNGNLIVGFSDHPGTQPPDEWKQTRTYQVAAGDPDPKYFYATFFGFYISQWDYFWLLHQLPGNGSNYWKANIRYWLL